MTVWLAGLLLAVGPNGWWIDARLETASPAYRALVPVDWLDDATGSLWIAFHEQPGWLMAAYLPPDAEEIRSARLIPDLASRHFDRLLPQLQVPRLLLRADIYRQGDGLTSLDALPVDSGEILYNALLDARLDHAARRGEPWTRELKRRAQGAMPSVPESHRTEAYRSAVIDFASHLLSVAGEIARQSQRHPRSRLCALRGRPATLFGTWSRALGDGRFPGHWQRPAEPATGTPSEWLPTRDVLGPEDKRWVVSTVLGVRWSGDPAIDFADFCAAVSERSGSMRSAPEHPRTLRRRCRWARRPRVRGCRAESRR